MQIYDGSWRYADGTIPADFLDGKMRHIVSTFDDEHLRLYVDGVILPVGSSDAVNPSQLPKSSTGLRTSNYDFGVGATRRMPPDATRLPLFPQRVYKRALSADEVAAHAVRPAGLWRI